MLIFDYYNFSITQRLNIWLYLMSFVVIFCVCEITCLLLSSVIICCHLMSFVIINCQLMSSVVIWCHLLSSYVTLWFLMQGYADMASINCLVPERRFCGTQRGGSAEHKEAVLWQPWGVVEGSSCLKTGEPAFWKGEYSV